MLQLSKAIVNLIKREQKTLHFSKQGIQAFGSHAVITNGYWVIVYTLPKGMAKNGIWEVTTDGLLGNSMLSLEPYSTLMRVVEEKRNQTSGLDSVAFSLKSLQHLLKIVEELGGATATVTTTTDGIRVEAGMCWGYLMRTKIDKP